MPYLWKTRLSLVFWLIRIAAAPTAHSQNRAPAADSVIAEYSLSFLPSAHSRGLVPFREISKPQLGLALSGGGLRGVAQIGALKTLEQNHIPVDVIVGTSIGAVVGGLYAAGYSSDELWEAMQSLQLDKILIDTPSRSLLFLAEKEKRARALLELRMSKFKLHLPEAYTPGQRLSETLNNLILKAPSHAFDVSQLHIPVRIVTTDLLSGKKVVFAKGSLLDAMRASIAIPLLLSPVEIDSMLLVDGGLLDNIPVDETRDAGADIVLAINCTANLREKNDINSPWTVADQVTTIMQQENNIEQLQKANLVLDFQDFSSTSIRKEDLRELYEEGQRRTGTIIPQLRSLLAEKERSWSTAPIAVGRIQLPEIPELTASAILPDTVAPRWTSEKEIQQNLEALYQTGFFADLHAQLVRRPNQTPLLRYLAKPLPRLQRVQFHGNRSIADSILAKPFADQLGKTLNHQQSIDALSEVNKIYRSQGFSLADVSPISFDEKTGVAHLLVSEGQIDSVLFQGQKTTRDFVLKREFPLKPGDVFQMAVAETGVNNLFGTGLFQSVSLMASPSGPDWRLRVRLQEKSYDVVRLGIHYDEERYGRAFLEWSDENLFGTANDMTLHAQYGTRNQLFSAQINANRLFRTYMTSQVNGRFQRDKFYYYQNGEISGEYLRSVLGLTLGAGLQIARFGTLSGYMRLENIRTKNVVGERISPMDLLVQTLGIASIVDTRDQVPFTDSGKYHKFSYEVTTGKHLGNDISFFKVQEQLTTYWTLGRRNTFSPRLLWGTSDLSVPFSEQYRLGGDDSFYGLRSGELLGRNMIIASLEYRYRLPVNRLFDFYLSGRFDFGAVWQNTIKVKAGDFISGKGLSLAIKTPVGPIAVSYGVASREQKRFYFSAGYNF